MSAAEASTKLLREFVKMSLYMLTVKLAKELLSRQMQSIHKIIQNAQSPTILIEIEDPVTGDKEIVLTREFRVEFSKLTIPIRLSYQVEDPYAITMHIVGTQIVWTFGRDLIRHGGGMGDVKVERYIDKTQLSLSVDDKTATFAVSTSELDEFMALVYHLVPEGHESQYIDWDENLVKLLEE